MSKSLEATSKFSQKCFFTLGYNLILIKILVYIYNAESNSSFMLLNMFFFLLFLCKIYFSVYRTSYGEVAPRVTLAPNEPTLFCFIWHTRMPISVAGPNVLPVVCNPRGCTRYAPVRLQHGGHQRTRPSQYCLINHHQTFTLHSLHGRPIFF